MSKSLIYKEYESNFPQRIKNNINSYDIINPKSFHLGQQKRELYKHEKYQTGCILLNPKQTKLN